LTIVGVTDEAEERIRPFITKHNIEYLIAIGGANGYVTRGIPHAWLVSAAGDVVWEGHPASLTDAAVEKELRHVRLRPSFKLPKELKRAAAQLNAGQYASGLRALNRYLQKPKSDEGADAARAAIEQVEAFGAAKLKRVQSLAEGGFYLDAQAALKEVEKMFRGTAIGDQAKAQQKEWKGDKLVRAEIQAGTLVAKASELIGKKKYKDAAAYLQRVLQSKHYSETRTRGRAEELYGSIREKLGAR
jgi:hypothetical protein